MIKCRVVSDRIRVWNNIIFTSGSENVSYIVFSTNPWISGDDINVVYYCSYFSHDLVSWPRCSISIVLDTRPSASVNRDVLKANLYALW